MTAATAPALALDRTDVSAPRSRTASLRRVVAHHPIGVVAAAIVVLLVLVAVFAPVLAPHSPTAHDGVPIEGPSLSHPAGTDATGRDVLSRTIYGARVSLAVGVIAVLIGTAVGVAVGMQSGYAGGRLDRFNMFVLDVGLSFPGILPVLVIVAAFGPSFWVLTLAIAFTSAPVMTRVVRGTMIKERESLYVDAARAMGATDARIILRHLLPNIAPVIVVLMSAGVPSAILAEAGLSFLGLGIRPPTPSWGGDLSGNARDFFELQPWIALSPGIALSLAVLAFNLLGDTLRDVFDPRLRGSR